jgi:predicted nucleotidyltransferase
MHFKPGFPTALHHDAAQAVNDFFSNIKSVDTVLLVNSCARNQAVPESDLDFAILVEPGTSERKIKNMESKWNAYSATHPALVKYKQLSQFAHLHLDIITGSYTPTILEVGVASDYFEIEIGNQVCYSAPMNGPGDYFKELQKKWLPYYDEALRAQRFEMTKNACQYDLDHIPFFIKRKLYFQAFDILCKAFQEYLQSLFIAHGTYPIAYNKWIYYQIAELMNLPGLYAKLPAILSVSNLESEEINHKANMLRELLDQLDFNPA